MFLSYILDTAKHQKEFIITKLPFKFGNEFKVELENVILLLHVKYQYMISHKL